MIGVIAREIIGRCRFVATGEDHEQDGEVTSQSHDISPRLISLKQMKKQMKSSRR
jgi:hypothetical protein